MSNRNQYLIMAVIVAIMGITALYIWNAEKGIPKVEDRAVEFTAEDVDFFMQ